MWPCDVTECDISKLIKNKCTFVRNICTYIAHCSRCSFSMLFGWVNAIKVWANVIKVWANAIKVWANAIEIQDQRKKNQQTLF